MDQRLEKLEQLQEQMQAQMQEKLAKIQQDMEESQRELLNQLKQFMAGGYDKGKSPVVNSRDDHKDPTYPLGGLIKQDSIERPEGAKKFCEFHVEESHDIQKCTEFRTMVQNLMDNKELEFYEEIKGLEEGEVYAAEEGSAGKAQKADHPVVIISKPMSKESGIQTAPKVIIQKPVSFPYKDNKKVPWNYDCNVTIPGKE
ncbi:hypothetical protein Gotur_034178, partial [Gossypium turneri]